MLSLQEIDEFETGLSGVDHNIRHHQYSSSMVKRQEFDDQRGPFYKRSLHFGIKNLEQYLRMNTYSKDSMQKGSVDLKAIAWLKNPIVLIVLGPYHGFIDLQLTLCATVLSPRRLHIVLRSHSAGTVLYLQVPSHWYTSTVLESSTSNSRYRSLYTGPSNASYSLSKASSDCTSILKRFHALFLPLCTLSQCLVLAMPPQSLKIDHLPSDVSAILRERYLAGTFSVVTQCVRAIIPLLMALPSDNN